MTKPFGIEPADIARLSPNQLTELLRILLHADVHQLGLPANSVEVSSNITVPDGGEDGRISWQGGPEPSGFIPNRITSFQVKAGKMAPAQCGKELVAQNNSVKPLVDKVLDEGGSYVLFASQELNRKQKNERILKMRNALSSAGKKYAQSCDLHIYDAGQISAWVNKYTSAIVFVKHRSGCPTERGVKDFNSWSKHVNLSIPPFAHVKSREQLMETIKPKLLEPRSCLRIMGLSGLGKTRMVFQVAEENEAIKSLVVYADAESVPNISALVSDWVALELTAVLVVDNCNRELHNRLVQEVNCRDSKMSLITMDYNVDEFSGPTLPLKLNRMSSNELTRLFNPAYYKKLPDLRKIVDFAQGFPQMAVLLAEARLNEVPNIGELSDDELADKLLWGRGDKHPIRHKIMQVCSLFDFFGIEKEVDNQLEYIAKIAGSDVDTVYECVQHYSDRGLIDRRGRFGQVVSKPLAMRLAGQWWQRNREQKQKEVIYNMPDRMVDAFCRQVSYMGFRSDVVSLTAKLCAPQSPFGQAEVILSDRGSKFFRALVEINPDATCDALYRVLNVLNRQQLLEVKGDVRRNIVCALEKLSFPKHLFEKSARCLLWLALAENESWSNNATGIFVHLFRVILSGTEAKPDVRFSVLQDGLDLNQPEVDKIILDALENVTSCEHFSRDVGAESRGMAKPLQDWRPATWKDIFSFWQRALDMLMVMLEGGQPQKERVASIINNSIGNFARRNRVDMLDDAVRKIVAVNDNHWPVVVQNITLLLRHGSDWLKPNDREKLKSWLALLRPSADDIAGQLKTIVVNPVIGHKKNANGLFVDVAAKKAKMLAANIAKDIESIYPHIELLTQGEQSKSFVFGEQLAIRLQDCTILLEKVLEKIAATRPVNIEFALGIFSGMYKKSPADWQTYIDKIAIDQRLVEFYPEFICTGKIDDAHLDKLIEFVRSDVVSASSTGTLAYSKSTHSIKPETIIKFCLELSACGPSASYTALHIIYMYYLGDKSRVDNIRSELMELLVAVPLHENKDGQYWSLSYEWNEMVRDILKIRDEDFAIALMKQIINSCQHDFDLGDLWHYIIPLLRDLMLEYGQKVWPIFCDAVVEADDNKRYWLQQLLKRPAIGSDAQMSILNALHPDQVIPWCLKNRDFAPRFIAEHFDITKTVNGEQKPTELFIQMLIHFGDDERVTGALVANMLTMSWSGSLVPHLKSDKEALAVLVEHPNQKVRKWVKERMAQIDKEIERESGRDAEDSLGIW